MDKKLDPRAARSKQILKDTVLTMLKNGTPINKLSVLSVTKEAGLNRTTFYLHYLDILDLIGHITMDILNQFKIKMQELVQATHLNEQKQLTELLYYLQENRQHLLILFQQGQFEKHLINAMKELIESRRATNKTTTKKMKVDSEIKAASVTGVIMWWLQQAIYLTPEHIAEQIHFMYRT